MPCVIRMRRNRGSTPATRATANTKRKSRSWASNGTCLARLRKNRDRSDRLSRPFRLWDGSPTRPCGFEERGWCHSRPPGSKRSPEPFGGSIFGPVLLTRTAASADSGKASALQSRVHDRPTVSAAIGGRDNTRRRLRRPRPPSIENCIFAHEVVDDEPTPAFCRGVELEDGSEDAAASRLCQSV